MKRELLTIIIRVLTQPAHVPENRTPSPKPETTREEYPERHKCG